MKYALEHHFVATNGQRLHVVQCGPPAGPLVVLLHGFPEFWYSWRRQIPALAAAGYRVWVPDQRGYNLSSKPTRLADYGLSQLGADVLGLLDAAGQQQAHIAGHDWGGIVAWYLAAQYPERVATASILNVPHPALELRNLWRLPDQLIRSWYVAFFQLPRWPEYVFGRHNWRFGTNLLRRTSRPGLFDEAELTRYREAWAQPGALTAMINWYRALRLPLGILWPRIRRPVQVIWGEQDAFLNRHWASLSVGACEQAQLHLFPQATHWVQLEAPEAVNALLLKFMAAPVRAA